MSKNNSTVALFHRPTGKTPAECFSILDKLWERVEENDDYDGACELIRKQLPDVRDVLAGYHHTIGVCKEAFGLDEMSMELSSDAIRWVKLLCDELQEETPSLSVILFAAVKLGGRLAFLERNVSRLTRLYQVGEKVSDGGHKGTEVAHGDSEEKQKRWRQYQDKLNTLASESPKRGYIDLCAEVAEHFGVHPGTIRRHTTNPKRKVNSPPTVQ